jgi:hypothetical protein
VSSGAYSLKERQTSEGKIQPTRVSTPTGNRVDTEGEAYSERQKGGAGEWLEKGRRLLQAEETHGQHLELLMKICCWS